MATTLYLRDSIRNRLISGQSNNSFRDLLSTRGAASTTGVVNSTASGSGIFWTKTGGGALLEWVSGRLTSGITVSGTITVNIRSLESSAANNCQVGIQFFKLQANGTEVTVLGGSFVIGTEMGTSDAANNWSFTPTSHVFSNGERIGVRAFINAVGTMGAGTCTMTYDGPTSAAAGDSFITFTETMTFDDNILLRVTDLNVTKNAVTSSEDLTVASWTKTGCTAAADVDVAPDGNTTADSLTSTVTNALSYIQATNFAGISGTAPQVWSAYVKWVSGPGWFAFQDSGNGWATFDVINGVVGSIGAADSTGTSAISNAGNGWYRCSWAHNQTVPRHNDNSTMRVGFATNTSSLTAQNIGDQLEIWGIQVEPGSSVGTYFPALGRPWYTPSIGNGLGGLRPTARLQEAASITLPGTGTLSFNTVARMAALFTWPGLGSVSVDSSIQSPTGIWSGEATFNGIGTLSAATLAIIQIQATMPGTGALSALSQLFMRAAATFSGVGSFSVNLIDQISDNAEFAGTGTLSVAMIQRHNALISFAGNGTLSAATIHKITASAIFNGVGTFQSDSFRFSGLQATFNGVGTLSVNSNLWMQTAATLSGTGGLSVATLAWMQGAATLPGTSTLSARVFAQMPTAVTFAGAGTLSVNTAQAFALQAVFNGIGGLSVAAAQRMTAFATFSGSSTLSVDSFRLTTAQATFNGAGTFSAVSFLQMPTAVTFRGIGTLSVATSLIMPTAVTFTGTGTLSVVANLRMFAAATFSGLGDFAVDSYIPGAVNNWSGEATWSGVGTLSVATIARMAALAQFSGSATLSVNTIQKEAVAATFSGTGPVSVTVTQVMRASATLSGLGGLSVYPNLVMRGAGIWGGAGALSCDSALGGHFAWDGQAEFDGVGGLRVSAGLIMLARATMRGQSTLIVIPVAPPQPAPVETIFYDFPIGRSLDSDYGIRASAKRDQYVMGRRRWR